MKTKIIKTLLPTCLGILTVLALLVLYNFMVYNGDGFRNPDNGFFLYFVPFATLIAMLIQYALTLTFWRKFKSDKKVMRLTLIQFTGLICIVCGLAFGFVFWETSLGISELIAVSITGIIAFAVYWTVNLITLKKLDKILKIN